MKACSPKNLAELSAAIGQPATDRAVATGIEHSWYSGGRDVGEIYKDVSNGSVSVEYELEPEEVDGFHDVVLDTLCEIDIKALECDPTRVEDELLMRVSGLQMSRNDSVTYGICEDIAWHVREAVKGIERVDGSQLDLHEVASELACDYAVSPMLDVEGSLEGMSVRSEIMAGERGDARNEFGNTDDLLHAASNYMWRMENHEDFDEWSDDFIDKDGNFQIPDDMHGTYLETFCEEQGTSFADIVNGADGAFAESMRDEIEACDGGYGFSVCVLMRQDIHSFIEDMCAAEGSDTAARAMTISAKSEPSVHLYSPSYGAGVDRGIELNRDMTIKSDEIAAALGEYESRDRRYSEFNGMHTVDETCCGLVARGSGPDPWHWAEVEYGEYGDCRGEHDANESLDEMCEAKSAEAEIGNDGVAEARDEVER